MQQSLRGKSSNSNIRTASPNKQELTIEAKITKESVSIEILQLGFPQSYIDFFYLTDEHHYNIDLRDSLLTQLKDRLTSAERLNRDGDTENAVMGYRDLGSYFQKQGQFSEACYFYDRSIKIANYHGLSEQEAQAYQGLGSCKFEIGDIEKAVEMFERGLDIAETNSLTLIVRQISKELLTTYKQLAEGLERSDISQALFYYEKCKETAGKARELKEEGTSSYKIGTLNYELGNYNEALRYHKSYYSLSQQAGYDIGITEALAAIAQTYKALGSIPQAIDHLEKLQEKALVTSNIRAQAEASLSLGLLYQSQGMNKKSVELLENHFSLAKQLGDRKMIDIARVKLGVIQASAAQESYIEVVSDNLKTLLAWRIKRTKF
jgi:tetratricopeptide (TPR) repeat protein